MVCHLCPEVFYSIYKIRLVQIGDEVDGLMWKGLFWIVFIFLIVRACSSSDDFGGSDYGYSDYDRGYEEGWMEVCGEVERISPSVYQELRNRRYC